MWAPCHPTKSFLSSRWAADLWTRCRNAAGTWGNKSEVKRCCINTLICLRSRVRYPQSPCPHRHYRISLTAASPWLNRKATLNTSPPSYWFSRPETPRPQRPLNYRPFYRELHQCWKLYRDMGVRDQSQYRPANSNSIQPLLETHTDLPDINKAVQRPAVLNNKDNKVKVSLHICATSSNQF